uniref:RHD domain-containing protein n=1 Tax=Maylandia zebra TaxID=106582 RepID=A0A3P9CK75_9CICH
MGRLLCSSLSLLLATVVLFPILSLLEEPRKRGRFRYECAGCPVGSILGVSSTKTRQTGPTIEVGVLFSIQILKRDLQDLRGS